MTRSQTIHNDGLEAQFIGSKDARAAVIVIHEVWGRTPHIDSICQQLSRLKFAVIAPNLYEHDKTLFTPENISKAIKQVWSLPLAQRYNRNEVARVLARRHTGSQTSALLAQLYSRRFRARMLADLIAWSQYALLKYHRVAAIGFSMGGGLSFKLAARFRKLSSCISFCGEPPTYQQTKEITAPMLAICAGQDDFMNSTVPRFVGGALRNRRSLILMVYGNAKHEFFNPKNSDYNASDARDAWNLVTSFLERTLLNNTQKVRV